MTDFAFEDIEDKEKLRDDLRKIRTANTFLLSLINDVLDISKIDSGKIELNPEPYPFSEYIAHIKNMFGANKPIASDEEWEKLCQGLNKLGKIAADRGFRLCYHHHMATVVQTFAETKRLLDGTDSRYVYLCFDTGHFTFAGEDPVWAAEEFGPRIGHVS